MFLLDRWGSYGFMDCSVQRQIYKALRLPLLPPTRLPLPPTLLPLPLPSRSRQADQLLPPCFECRFGVSHVHFWSLDVEGAELAVLQAFDFDRVAVDVIVVETDGHNKTKDAAVGSILARNGFIAVEHGPDQTPYSLNTMVRRLQAARNGTCLLQHLHLVLLLLCSLHAASAVRFLYNARKPLGISHAQDTFFVHKRYMLHRSSAPGITELRTR